MIKGDSFSYAWKTDGEVLFFDFHGEPANDTSGYFKSFANGTNSESSGSLTATFTGTHGWYWKNSSAKPVVITLKTRGDYQPKEAMKPIPDQPPADGGQIKSHESIF